MIDDFFATLEAAGIAGGVAAMDRGAELIATRAREHAPVRRVFKGQDEAVRTRLKSISEIEGDREIRASLGLGPESVWIHPPSVVTKAAPKLLHLRTVARGTPHHLKSDWAEGRLNRRGRYELKSGRSIHNSELGGRLRDDIFAVAARLEGHSITSRVVSPTPYGKFQEFGTAHNAAHPYLRPAVHESKAEILDDIRHGVAASAREALSGLNVRVKLATWTLKARA